MNIVNGTIITEDYKIVDEEEKMDKKMIVFDLDGTLLDDSKKISDFTRDVLAEFKSKGGLIALATGRVKKNTDLYAKQINADYVICQNGSIVYERDLILSQIEIDQQLVEDLIHSLLKIKNSNLAVAYPTRILTNNKQFVKSGVRDYCDFSVFPLNEIQKISLFTNSHDQVRNFDFDSYGCKVLYSSEDPNYFVIMNKNVDKLYGIRTICDKLNLKLDDVVAFGDDYNDYEMLRNCGIGVAVRNANELLKKEVQYNCGENNEDGPAKWIKDNLL